MLKEIKGFKGYFINEKGEVYCNLGRGCRSKDRSKTTELYKINPRAARNGYMRVYMRNTDTWKRQDRYIHRLVAEHFIENPEHKKCVNHIDCDRSNNNVKNLEWVTSKENSEYAFKMNRMKRDKLGRFVGCV